MPSESSEYNPKSSSPNQDLIESPTPYQYGHPRENKPTPDTHLEQRNSERDEPQGSNGPTDLGTSIASTAKGSQIEKPDGLGQISDDALEKFHEVHDYFKPSGTTIKSIRSSVIERPLKLSSLSQSSGVEKLPNEVLNHIFSHLAPTSLAASALVSSRFNELITSPHAWRAAFLRYFPGQDRRLTTLNRLSHDNLRVSSSIRSFNRLTTLATWKSEYVFRTRLLSCIRRVRKHKRFTASDKSRHYTHPGVLYDSELSTAVTHLHAIFGVESSQRSLRFSHASAYTGTMSQSNPTSGEIESSNCSEPLSSLTDFNLRFPGIEMYGMGSSTIVGNPNVMDVSSSYGMVLGEGFPGGEIYHRSSHNRHISTFPNLDLTDAPHLGIPCISSVSESVSSIWISKSNSIPSMSEGLVFMISGSSAGIISTYGLPKKPSHQNRRPAYEITSRCVLSPGVPIVAIEVDECFTPARLVQNRIWAVALNAFGEVFYLTKFPRRHVQTQSKVSKDTYEDAWLNGRTVQWFLVEPSRRLANSDPSSEMFGSYSPRSSWDGMCLSKRQLVAECHEIEQFLKKSPADFRRSCLGWNMKRTVVVDFAGNGENYAGECVVVFNNCNDLQSFSTIRKYLRRKDMQSPLRQPSCQGPPTLIPLWANEFYGPGADDSPNSASDLNEEWLSSILSLGKHKNAEITAVAIDMSNPALKTVNEDQALWSETSVLSFPDIGHDKSDLQSINSIPGQRGRFVAVGTSTGMIMIWDIRTPHIAVSGAAQKIEPIRFIQTGSPQVSSLALTALYIVHGGSDGMVQAWDPLASQTEPLRTIKSRSNKADRRERHQLRQRTDLGRRFTAVSAIRLDPDPMTLRGVAACGFNLKYWSYNDWSTEKHRENKRKRNRALRQSNESFMSTNKLEMKTYIASEKLELEEEEAHLQKEKNRFANRYGTDLGSEEEMLAYATMLSRESLPQSSCTQSSDSVTNAAYFDSWSSTSATLDDSSEINEHSVLDYDQPENDGADDDLALAIQRSLLAEDSSAATGSTRYGPFDSRFSQQVNDVHATSSLSVPERDTHSSPLASYQAVSESEQADIELAVQLSLSEIRKDEESQNSR